MTGGEQVVWRRWGKAADGFQPLLGSAERKAVIHRRDETVKVLGPKRHDH